MNRLLGNRGKPADEEDKVTNDYNECVAEIKKENPYIGHLALQQEAMKRVAQRRATKQDSSQNTNEDFAPQRIAFRRRSNNKKNIKDNKESNSLNQSLSRSFIGFLSSSTKTEKTSNKTVFVESHEKGNNFVMAGRRTSNNFVMAGRRTSNYNEEEDGAHTTAFAMREIELSDSEESSQRSSLSKKLRSLKGTIRRQSASRRRSSANSSISTLQRNSSDLSVESTEKSVESTTDDSAKPRHNPQLYKNAQDCSKKEEEEEEDIMDFVEEFLAKGGTVHPARTERTIGKVSSRRSSLFSLEENRTTCGESACKSITSLGEGSSSLAARNDSLICGWTRGSLNESEFMGADGDLICNWDVSNSDLSSETKKLPREINVGSNPSKR